MFNWVDRCGSLVSIHSTKSRFSSLNVVINFDLIMSFLTDFFFNTQYSHLSCAANPDFEVCVEANQAKKCAPFETVRSYSELPPGILSQTFTGLGDCTAPTNTMEYVNKLWFNMYKGWVHSFIFDNSSIASAFISPWWYIDSLGKPKCFNFFIYSLIFKGRTDWSNTWHIILAQTQRIFRWLLLHHPDGRLHVAWQTCCSRCCQIQWWINIFELYHFYQKKNEEISFIFIFRLDNSLRKQVAPAC